MGCAVWGQHCLFLFLLRNIALNESKLRAGAGAAVVLPGYAGPPAPSELDADALSALAALRHCVRFAPCRRATDLLVACS